MPWEYVELVLCRDIYHCTPDQLAAQPLPKMLRHLAMMQVEKNNADHDRQWRAMQ